MADAFQAPKEIKGRIILLAGIEAKPGKGDELAKIIAEIRKLAESSSEPETHTYRTIRGAGKDADKFRVFEEYSNQDAIAHHISSEQFGRLAKSDLLAGPPSIEFFEEFK